MTDVLEDIPFDLENAHAMTLAERVARLKLEIEKVRCALFGSRSGRKARLLDQMEMQLEEREVDAGSDERSAQMAAKLSNIPAFERRRPSRKPFPDHLRRERVVILHPPIVLAADCPHGDNRTVPIRARSKTDTGGIWTDGRICLTNNVAERALRGFALSRKSWLCAGSDCGADRSAFMATLIMTARLNQIDPQAWLADILARIADQPSSRLSELQPWEWKRNFVIKQPVGKAIAA